MLGWSRIEDVGVLRKERVSSTKPRSVWYQPHNSGPYTVSTRCQYEEIDYHAIETREAFSAPGLVTVGHMIEQNDRPSVAITKMRFSAKIFKFEFMFRTDRVSHLLG